MSDSDWKRRRTTWQVADSAAAVRDLATDILNPARKRPIVLLSTAADSDLVPLDARSVHEAIGDVADTVVIQTGQLSRELEQLLPDRLQVYGGAGRSYPADLVANPDPHRSPLRFPGHQTTEQIITDALAHAHAVGAFHGVVSRTPPKSGEVRAIVAGRAVVQFDNGGLGTVWGEATFASIPLEWALTPGQKISGSFDPDSGRLLLDNSIPSDAGLAKHFPHRSVTLALVTSVNESEAVLALHPSHAVRINLHDVSSNERDAISDLLTVGDVTRARVLHLSGERIHLQLLDLDDDEPTLPALTLVEHGPAWLELDRPLVRAHPVSAPIVDPEPLPALVVPEPVVEEAVAPPVVAPVAATESRSSIRSLQLLLETERARLRELEDRVTQLGISDSQLRRMREVALADRARTRDTLIALADRERELADANAELRRLRAERRATRTGTVVPEEKGPGRDRWSSPEAWVRHEVVTAWAARIDPQEQRRYPLPRTYVVGPQFADSLSSLDVPLASKALRAVVDVLVGRAHKIPGRDLHPLRRGNGGADPDYVRPDGGRVMRAAVELNTPAARRLHYVVLPSGVVELLRVVSHDVMEP